MKHITKMKLAAVQQWCDLEGKSTAYMYQLMQDTCYVNIDTINAYMRLSEGEHLKLRSEVKDFVTLLCNLPKK